MSEFEKRPAWFKMPASLFPTIENATDKQIGRGVRAAMVYFLKGETSQLDPLAQILFANMKYYIDEAIANYHRDVENGKKGGRPKKRQESQNPGLPRVPHIETETDTDTDTETDDLYFIKENNKEKAALQPRSQAKEPKRTKETALAIPTSFQIPDVGQVEAYCRELGLQVDAAGFVDYYQAKGWMLGTNPMQDWQAAVRSWNRRRDKNYAQSEITLPYPIGVQL